MMLSVTERWQLTERHIAAVVGEACCAEQGTRGSSTALLLRNVEIYESGAFYAHQSVHRESILKCSNKMTLFVQGIKYCTKSAILLQHFKIELLTVGKFVQLFVINIRTLCECLSMYVKW
jgi:hypothetical protein